MYDCVVKRAILNLKLRLQMPQEKFQLFVYLTKNSPLGMTRLISIFIRGVSVSARAILYSQVRLIPILSARQFYRVCSPIDLI